MKSAATENAWTERVVLGTYVVLIAIFLVLYLVYSFGSFKAHFNSDSAANVLFAREMIYQRTLFPQWNNSTGIFMPLLMPNLLVMPIFIGLLHDGFAAFRAAVAVDQLLMLALLWWLSGKMGLSRAGRLFLVAFIVVSPSLPFMIQTTMLAGKAWTFVFLLLIAWLAQAVVQARDSRQLARSALALSLIAGVIFVDLANAAVIVPGMAAGFAAQWVAGSRRDTRRMLLLAGCMLAALLVGQLILHTALRGNTYALLNHAFTDLPSAVEHLGLFARGMIEMLGAVSVGATPYSIAGAASGAKFVLLLIALAAPFHLLGRYLKLDNPHVRLLTVVWVVSFAIRLYVYLFTGISDGNPGTARYFIVEILLGLMLVTFHLQQSMKDVALGKLVLLMAIVPFALTSPLLGKPVSVPSKDQRLLSQLERNQLRFGYATFWNANAATALSNGAVVVRPIEFDGGLLAPKRWLSSDRWYEGNAESGESFLLLSQEESRSLDLSLLFSTIGKPVRTIDLEGYVAMVYPFDLMTRLDWNHRSDLALSRADSVAELAALGDVHVDEAAHELVVHWRVRNLGHATFSSYGLHPVNLGLHLKAEDRRILANDLARQPVPVLGPDQSASIETRIPLDKLAGGTRIEADLVQEGVAWFHDRGGVTAQIDIPRLASDAKAEEPESNVLPISSAHALARRAGPADLPPPRKAGSARR